MSLAPFLISDENRRLPKASIFCWKVGFHVLFLFSVLLFFAGPQATQAQNRVRILQSDFLEGVSTQDGRVRKLTGNVQLQTDDFSLSCDSARQYLDLDELVAYGNIEIASENETIWSDKVTYHLIDETSLFEGRVVMQSNGTLLFSDRIYYSFRTETATFPGMLRLEDENGVLTADSGTYFHQADSAVFRGNVQVADSMQYLEADSMFTRRADEYYEMHGRVFIDDRENRIRLSGNYARSSADVYRRIEGNSRMMQVSEDLSDTTHLWSDWLEVTKSDTLHTFSAGEQVNISAPSHASISDQAEYIEEKSRFLLTGDARLWYEQMQLSSPVIEFVLEQDTLRSLKAWDTPFAVQSDTVFHRLHQITGDTLFMLFEHGKLASLVVRPRGHILYFIKNEQDEPDGAIEITAEMIQMIFIEGELNDVKGLRNIDGTFYPETAGLDQKRLDGFLWEPEDMPQPPPVMILPRLPGIPEEIPFELPPRFLHVMKSLPGQDL